MRAISMLAAAAGMLMLGGCFFVYDYSGYQAADGGAPDGGVGGMGGTGGQGGTAGQGAAGSGSGAGGAGGQGGGDPCDPANGTSRSCYTGPEGTSGIGACQAGLQLCESNVWGPCNNEVVPKAELGNNDSDEDCNDSKPGGSLWGKRYGNGKEQFARRVAVDAMGDAYVAGHHFGTLAPLNSDDADTTPGHLGFLAKVAAGGTAAWSYSLDVQGTNDRALGLAVAGGRVIVGGDSEEGGKKTGFVQRWNPDGTKNWLNALQIPGATVEAVAADGSKTVYAVGTFTGMINVGPYQLNSVGVDVFVARLNDADGDVLGAFSFGGPADDTVADAAACADGVLIVGTYRGDLANIPGPPPGGANGDVFAMKINIDGTVGWARGFNDKSSASGARGLAVAADTSCNAFIAGALHGTLNFDAHTVTAGANQAGFVAKLNGNAQGSAIWAKGFSGKGPVEATGIAVNDAGALAVVGEFAGSVVMDPQDAAASTIPASDERDLFLAKLDQAGSYTWAATFGVDDLDTIPLDGTIATALDTEGNVLIAGDWNQELRFGTSTIVAGGTRDVFIGKLNP
jgi:hypothetical protein